MNITKKQIVKTAILPGIFPRIKSLFGSGPLNLAYVIALVYATVRILPNNHAFLKKENIGSYTIRQAIIAASNHIRPSRQNIDQIIIFFSVIVALFILLVQFILLLITIFVSAAHAQAIMPTTIPDFFQTPNPQEDIAFRLMDLVFGIPDLFGSKDFSVNNFHSALHGLFEFYSYGLLIVGAIIIVYYIIAVVAETAQSGIPFGQRFNKTWAPIRIILFFALLLPITNGLNGAQYITLNVAKLGSGMASTGWLLFNDQITESLTGDVQNNIATPTPPDVSFIPAYMLIVKTCQKVYNMHVYNDEDEFFSESWNPNGDTTGIRAWAVYRERGEGRTYNSELMSATTFQNISENAGSPTFNIVFGVKDDEEYTDHNGAVLPVCGSLSFTITDIAEPGSAIIHTAYYDLVQNIWSNNLLEIDDYAENYVEKNFHNPQVRDLTAQLPDETYRSEWIEYLENYLGEEEAGVVSRAVNAQIEGTDWQLSKEIKDFGWGGAGIWYNQIAIQNGALVSALHQLPTIVSYPNIMERIYEANLQENESLSRENYFNRANLETDITDEIPGESLVSNVLNEVYLYWDGSADLSNMEVTPNALINAINVILGTEGLFEMCANAETHPLAQLSAVGKSMVDSSIRAYISAGIFSIASIIPNPFSGAAGAFASFFGTIGSIGLLVGFILFYVLPIMPFLYFFFAVGGWVKGIFEAMVAMPLWALAHLRIDSESIPGEAALKGYYLIFEIFIRPILIVFGLLASITIFSASVKVLNDIFYLAISNLAGHDPEFGTACFQDPPVAEGEENNRENLGARGPIDEFFFTVLYTIVVYLLATASFKMIDMLPNNILRWINAEVPSFGDNAGDNAEGLMKYITIAGSQFGGGLSSSIGGVGKGLQGSVQQGIGFLR